MFGNETKNTERTKEKETEIKIQTMTTIAKACLGKTDKSVCRRSMDSIYHRKVAGTDMVT